MKRSTIPKNGVGYAADDQLQWFKNKTQQLEGKSRVYAWSREVGIMTYLRGLIGGKVKCMGGQAGRQHCRCTSPETKDIAEAEWT